MLQWGHSMMSQEKIMVRGNTRPARSSEAVLLLDVIDGPHCSAQENIVRYLVYNLFVTSKNETRNSRIHEFKVRQESLLKPFLMVYYFLFITLKNILSLAFSF